MRRHVPVIIITVVACLVAFAVLAAATKRRSSIEKLACVSTSARGELQVIDFDDQWGPKAWVHRDIKWDPSVEKQDGLTPAEARAEASRIIGVLQGTVRPPQIGLVGELGAVRLTATCDGETYQLELPAPRAPTKLSSCLDEHDGRLRCARNWARDLAVRADPRAVEVAEAASEE